MKTCSKCGEEKSLDSFGKRNASLDGLQNRCRECRNAEAIMRNADPLVKARAKELRARPEYREVYTARRQWRKKYDPVFQEQRRRGINTPAKHAGVRRRQAAKLQRTPSWANDQLVTAYYKEAKQLEELTGIQFHVDHIIPLRGEMVSGLHVETNLQILTAHENRSKKNRFDPETFAA